MLILEIIRLPFRILEFSVSTEINFLEDTVQIAEESFIKNRFLQERTMKKWPKAVWLTRCHATFAGSS